MIHQNENFILSWIKITCSVMVGVVVLSGAASNIFAGKIQYTYDPAGRLTAEDYGAGKVTTFTYDLNGNLLTNRTAVGASADIRIPSISGSSTGINAGNPIIFTMIVTNTGPDVASEVVLTDPLQFGIVPTGANASQGTCVIDGRLVTCNLGVLVPSGGSVVTITAIRGIAAIYTNVVTAISTVPDPNLANNTAQVAGIVATPPLDGDSDGIPNWWEFRYFNNNFSAQPDVDSDGDGVNNLEEFMADTNPTDSSSVLRIEELIFTINSPDEFSVTILTSPMRRYHLQFTEDIANPVFMTVDSADGTGGLLTLMHTPNTPTGIYRVLVEIP